MKSTSRFLAVLAAFALALFALGASAQDAAEPTVDQIYKAANSGNLDRADAMIDQVLKAHPRSAKAHYVKAELAARERKWDVAKSELGTAEKLAPGLPFAKAESVQALRNQLSNAATASTAPAPTRRMGAPADGGSYGAAPAQRSFPWGTLAIVGLVFVVGIALLRRRTVTAAPDAGYGGAYGNTSAAPYGQTGYGPFPPPDGGIRQGYPQPGYPQQPSMGSTIARGVGTGLAVGAGVFAAEEIGRRMFGHEAQAGTLARDTGNSPTLDQIDDGMRRNLNTDMGGDDFGVADGGWDDGGGGGGDDVGGGGWDS